MAVFFQLRDLPVLAPVPVLINRLLAEPVGAMGARRRALHAGRNMVGGRRVNWISCRLSGAVVGCEADENEAALVPEQVSVFDGSRARNWTPRWPLLKDTLD